MSDELIERLRKQRPNGECITVARLMDEAADEIARLTAQITDARAAERADVVAWFRSRLKGYTDPWGRAADAIEAGEHLTRDTIADSDGDDGA